MTELDEAFCEIQRLREDIVSRLAVVFRRLQDLEKRIEALEQEKIQI